MYQRISRKIREFVLKRDGYKCLLCGTTEDLTMDHIKPRSRDGDDRAENLQTLCKRCNEEKGARHKMQFDYRNNKSDRAARQLRQMSNPKVKRIIRKMKNGK